MLAGLAESERVAVRANFLLDSESRLRAAIGGAGAAHRPEEAAVVKKLIAFSADNRFLVLLGVAALCALAVHTLDRIRLDALPDLSDTQVTIYSRWDRSPDVVEDQVTYPIVSAMLGAPRVKAVRGFSDFGFSFVYVIFEDGTDIYWARFFNRPRRTDPGRLLYHAGFLLINPNKTNENELVEYS